MTTHTFGGVRHDAPLFNSASLDDLLLIVQKMSSASYHFADDTGGEWTRARDLRNEAAALCNKLGLGFRAVECLHKEKPQLIPLDDIIDAMLRDARK